LEGNTQTDDELKKQQDSTINNSKNFTPFVLIRLLGVKDV